MGYTHAYIAYNTLTQHIPYTHTEHTAHSTHSMHVGTNQRGSHLTSLQNFLQQTIARDAPAPPSDAEVSVSAAPVAVASHKSTESAPVHPMGTMRRDNSKRKNRTILGELKRGKKCMSPSFVCVM